MATSRHTYIHTHNFRICSHASVGLAQARPNNVYIYIYRYIYYPIYISTTVLSYSRAVQYHAILHGTGVIAWVLLHGPWGYAVS